MRRHIVVAIALPVLWLAATVLAPASTIEIEMVTVGDPGNTAFDVSGRGTVDYVYQIGKYEVTNQQYTAFLNVVDPDGTDLHDLYDPGMGGVYGGISFDPNAPDGSKYTVIAGRENKPVNYIEKYDTYRFANWLHNGQGSGSTETGAYDMAAGALRSADATFFLPTDAEWFKAAFYDAAADDYRAYTTSQPLPLPDPPEDPVDPPGDIPGDPGDDDGGGGIWELPTPPSAEPPPGTNLISGSANYNYAVGNLTDVGAYTTKPSSGPYGTFDQGGNVWEWVDRGETGPFGHLLRGGSFKTSHWDLSFDANYDGILDGGPQPDVGFRIAGLPVAAAVPEPSSLILWNLSAGLLALIRWRRKRARSLCS